MGFGAVEADTPGEMAATAQYNMMMQLLPGEIQVQLVICLVTFVS